MKLFGKKGKDAPDNSDLGEEDLGAALDGDLTETPVGDDGLNDPNFNGLEEPSELDPGIAPKTLSAPSRKLSVAGGGGKRNLLILALLVLVAGGGGAYFFLMGDSEDYNAPVHVTAAAPVSPIADAPPQPMPAPDALSNAAADPLAAMPAQPGIPQIEPSPLEPAQPDPAQTAAADPLTDPLAPPADQMPAPAGAAATPADAMAASADTMLPPADAAATDPAAALGQPPADEATPVAALPDAAPGEVPPEMPSPEAMAGATGADTTMPALDNPDANAAANAQAPAATEAASATTESASAANPAPAANETVPSWAAPGTTAVPGTTNPAVKPTSPNDAELAIVQNAAVLDQLSRPATDTAATTPATGANGTAATPATTEMPFDPATQKNDVNEVLKQLQQNTEVTAVRRPMPPSYMTIKKERDAGDVDSRLVSARTALSQGRNAAALELFEDLHRDYPKDKRALMGRAVAMQKLGQDESALSAYEAVLNADPKNIDALTNMLGLLKSRDPGLAVEKLQQLRDAYPYQGDITAQLGVAYAANGQYDQALKYLDMAESLKPGSAYVLYNRSVLLDRMGRTGDAAVLYRRILRMAADGELDQPLPLDSIRNRLAVLR